MVPYQTKNCRIVVIFLRIIQALLAQMQGEGLGEHVGLFWYHNCQFVLALAYKPASSVSEVEQGGTNAPGAELGVGVVQHHLLSSLSEVKFWPSKCL